MPPTCANNWTISSRIRTSAATFSDVRSQQRMNTNQHELSNPNLFVCIRVHSWPKVFGLFACSFLLAACGYVGNPLPPTLDIPQPISDLRVAEYGEKILVEFTVPPLTTEGLALKSIRSLDLRIGPAPAPWNDNAWASSAKQVDCAATQ